MIQFYDLDEAPDDPPVPLAERPLVCELPKPPVAWFGGLAHVLERVPIRDLEAWREKHGLRFVRTADCGQHGLMAVYEYIREGEDDDADLSTG
jgi:hypothetical protein